MPTSDLEEAERQAVNEVKGTYFLARTGAPAVSEWREHLREHGESATEEVSRTVAQIINELILSPEGAPLQGNIHLHCGGGMHRTGMIMGIMDRCINGTAYPIIEADYKRHVAWRSDERTGGFEQANLDFITSFDCGLIKTPQ